MTYISISAAPGRARLETRAGALVPRVIETGPESARVAIVAAGALLLGGDTVTVTVTVGAGCTLELEDIGGTVAYNADGVESEWIVEVIVEANALLIWHGLPFVVADGANVDRRTSVLLRGPGALACLRETIVLGRTGERGGRIDLRTNVRTTSVVVPTLPLDTNDPPVIVEKWAADEVRDDDDEPLFVERLMLRGADPVPGEMGGNRVLDSLLLLGSRSPDGAAGAAAVAVAAAVAGRRGVTDNSGVQRVAASEVGATEVLELEGPASVVRSLQREAHRSILLPVWDAWCAHARSVHAATSPAATSLAITDRPTPHVITVRTPGV